SLLAVIYCASHVPRFAACCGLKYSFFFSSRRRHTRSKRDWSSDVCSSDLKRPTGRPASATLRQAFPDVADQLVDQSLGDTLAKGSSSRVEWQCPNGHRWHAVVYNRTASKNPTGCPVCAGKLIQPGVNDLATLRPDVAALLKDQSLATTLSQFSNKKVELRCTVNPQHTWNAPVSRLTKQGSGCPVCSGRVPETGTSDLANPHQPRTDGGTMTTDPFTDAARVEALRAWVKESDRMDSIGTLGAHMAEWARTHLAAQ